MTNEKPHETPDGEDALASAVATQAAIERASAILGRATIAPEAVAAENAQLRSSVKGAHALMHALVLRLAAPDEVIHLPRAEWQTHDPRQELVVEALEDGSVKLWVHVANRAERRARR